MIFSLLLLGVVLSGCKSGKTCDARGDMPDQCQIHNRLMRSEKFPNPHRTDPPPQEYLQARVRFFIHAKPILLGLPDDCKEVEVYICDDCVHAETLWKAAHPGMAP